jgi:hypothetical protein
MSDILAFLDRVIDELQPDAAAGTSREKWRKTSVIPVATAPETGTGAPNPLTERRLPVLPVLPVTKQDMQEVMHESRKKLIPNFRKKVAPTRLYQKVREVREVREVSRVSAGKTLPVRAILTGVSRRYGKF